MKHYFRNLTLTLLVGALPVAPVDADQPLPEVVVTASLRQDTTLDTAASVSVVTEEVIAARAAQHFEDVINTLANVNYAAGSNRARFFQIRGIGERSQFVNPINPSVGVLVDDVDFSGAATIATLMDVQQVEVLRGPQGTRYGANALAGLINIITSPPTDERFARFKLMTGGYDTETLGMVLNAPLNQRLRSRLVVESHESDGYISNDFLGRNDTNGRDELTVRGRLAWQGDQGWSLDLTVADINIDNGYDAFSLDNTRHTLADEPGFDRQDSTWLALKGRRTWERVQVQALLNQSDSDLGYGYDEDWAFTGIHPAGYTSTDHYFRERKTTSAELRLLSTGASRWFGDTTDWVLGFYYLASRESLEREYTYASGPFFSDYDFDTLAVFTRLDAALTANTSLSLGLRLEERDTRYDDSEAVAFSPKDSLWGGKLALEHRLPGEALLYASVSRGYKAGGFNTSGSLDADLRSFDSEYLIEYEIGYKALLADGALELQLAVFHDDRHDQQVKSSLVRPGPDGSTQFIDFFGNAAEGTNRGAEMDLRWSLTEAVFLTANAGWLDAAFDEFINEFGEDLSDRDQAHAPGYMYGLALHYEQGPWFASLSVDGKDEFYFSDRHSVQSEDYNLYNASLGYIADHWKLTLWGRNLTDEDYFVRAFGSFGNDPRKSYITEPYFQYGEPRITGLTLEFHFGEK